MKLTPWFYIGVQGAPHRSGRYYFELWITEEVTIHIMATYTTGDNQVITDDGRFIGITYGDCWRGVLK